MCGVFDCLQNCTLNKCRSFGTWLVKWTPDPLDSDVIGIQLLDAPKETFVQRKNVFHLCWRTNPVLCRKTKNGEPPNIAIGAHTNYFSQIVLAGSVPFSAGEPATRRPATIAVHDAGDMDRSLVIRRVHSEHLTDVGRDGVRQ